MLCFFALSYLFRPAHGTPRMVDLDMEMSLLLTHRFRKFIKTGFIESEAIDSAMNEAIGFISRDAQKRASTGKVAEIGNPDSITFSHSVMVTNAGGPCTVTVVIMWRNY